MWKHATPPSVLLAVCAISCSQAQDDPSRTQATGPTKFVRLVQKKDSQDEGKLEVAVVRYRKGNTIVDLLSAVHIAEASHYSDLDKLFLGYDALLYELVAPEGTRPRRGRRGGGGLSFLQRAMTDGLDLAFQLDSVDYSPDNFVHADMTPSEFEAISEERGESILTLMFRAMRTEMQRLAEQGDGESGGEAAKFDLVSAFQKGEGRHLLRWSLAQQMESIERISAGFSGPDGESVLVEGRNKKCMKVFDRELANGKKKIGIYYGAAHMPDFEKRLTARGFQKQKVTWLTAWDLTKRPDPERYKSSRRKDGKKER